MTLPEDARTIESLLHRARINDVPPLLKRGEGVGVYRYTQHFCGEELVLYDVHVPGRDSYVVGVNRVELTEDAV